MELKNFGLSSLPALVVGVAVACAGVSGTARAAVIEQDYLTAGDGLLMFDTVNSRQWVDVTHTAGLSVNGFLSTSVYATGGFTFASQADLQAFFQSAGAADVRTDDASFTSNNYAAATLLYGLMEHTSPFSDMGGDHWIHGFVYETPSTATLGRIGVGEAVGFPAGTASFDLASNGSWSRNATSPEIGVWAWRAVARNVAGVPEPASWALMITGFGAMGAMLRWRRGTFQAA